MYLSYFTIRDTDTYFSTQNIRKDDVSQKLEKDLN